MRLGIRWTIGDVAPPGFEALRLSIHGAYRLFGSDAAYAVYVNSISIDEAIDRSGPTPNVVEWRAAPAETPRFLQERLDDGMAQGVAWKLAPLRAFPDRHELALDNDVIIWRMPTSLHDWLENEDACLIAEDVARGHGIFAALCGPAPRNSGIRGLPPGFPFEGAIRQVLALVPGRLDSELDEQGLQVAALSLQKPPLAVSLDEVTICSPFPPHQPHLGRCGAHFVGLNSRELPWRYYGRPATAVRLEHWSLHRPTLYARVGLPTPECRMRLRNCGRS
jgi:hypothetical protein